MLARRFGICLACRDLDDLCDELLDINKLGKQIRLIPHPLRICSSR